MTNIPLRPAGVNFWGVFGIDGSYRKWDFDNWWKPQIDAVKSIGANLFVFFGDVKFVTDGSGLPLRDYISHRKEVVEYLQKVGMYALTYASFFRAQWGSTTNNQAIRVFEADAAMMGNYPNVIGYVTTDEPFQDDQDPAIIGRLADQYAAVKAVLPSDIPVCTAPNPCGNGAHPVFAYGGQQKTNCDAVARYCDFFAFHPFSAVSLSDSAALRAAYPGKEIIMPSSVLASEGDRDIATKAASIMGLVGSNGFRGMGWWIALDYPIEAPTNTYGMFNRDFTPRTAKTNAFKSNIWGSYPSWPTGTIGDPKRNNYLRW